MNIPTRWSDWRKSWGWVLNTIDGADFLAMHAYTHDSDLNRIRSNQRFSDPPLIGVFYDLRVLESQQAIIPKRFADKPVVVTETNHYLKSNGKVGWNKEAGDWVHAAYEYFEEQGATGVALFRYNFDDWHYNDNASVLNALKNLAE